ncbi:MAG: hypothetical protein ACYTGN_17235 [Planctomycetota bacterium]|jgi:hypothetical protein
MRGAVIVLLVAGGVHAGGATLAKAQKAGDLAAIQAAVRDLEPRGAAALHALMRDLDPRRSGAFVSAHILARNLVLDATRTGDMRFVADARTVMAAHGGTGRCARTMALYADALVSEPREAAFLLDKALATMRAEAWTYLSMHAAVELAATRIRLGDAAAAARAIASIEEVYPKGADRMLRPVLQRLYGARLEGAPHAVAKAYERVVAPHAGGLRGLRAGGPGGRVRDRRPGRVAVALPGFPADRPLVTVRRTAAGFVLREAFDAEFAHTQKPRDGLWYHADGGVTLGFWGHAVGVACVGGERQPSPKYKGPPAHRAYYFLARDETWGFDKRGNVVIRKR